MATGAALSAGRPALLGQAAGSGSVQLPGTTAVLAAWDGGLLGLVTSSGLVSRRPTSYLGRLPTDGKRTSAPLSGPAYMDRGGIRPGFLCRGLALKTRSPLLPARYLLCDINLPEGFSLRRGICIHIAFLLKTLLKMEESVLVLPPWGRLYHWQSLDIHQVRIPWSDFFDPSSLNRNIPDTEYEQFIAADGLASCFRENDMLLERNSLTCSKSAHLTFYLSLSHLDSSCSCS
ncbi:uncharacterized protein LOC116658042 [Camelus ferus]|uniref:GDP-fucose protein O-fucosyltransferase 2 n=1 Tax=Camelus ferus TaxID=419612 RepID=A0A8B8RJW2_CAMFR|nr:uncharacterized protein LOC116658042 [Camelus ferus]